MDSIKLLLILIICVYCICACGPGRAGNRRRNLRKMTPLVYKQYSPNLSENNMIASGPSEGRITRKDPRYKELVPNYNPDILFKDAEGTGASRLMTQRLKEKLDILSISVMNQWPGVRLRVLKGWDEYNFHAMESLHYEGRAVDLATSDRDKAKNGMLARLALHAGFDWVYYETRYHIHASVKSEKTHSLRAEGCFLGSSYVQTKDRGQITMDNLKIGDEILSKNSQNKLEYSKVIMFLDLDYYATKLYYFIETDNGAKLALTESHLIFVANSLNEEAQEEFASYVKPGSYVYVPEESILTKYNQNLNKTNFKEDNKLIKNQNIKLVKVINVYSEIKTGAYSPLTNLGTLVVDGIVTSCYAQLLNQNLAHFAFLPVRLFDSIYSSWTNLCKKYFDKSKYSYNLSTKIDKKDNLKRNILIKVDRRIVNSKILTILDNINNNSTTKRQYNLHYSLNPQQGIHWYAYLLYILAKLIIPSDYMYEL